jgi:hypothetical protein
MRLERLCILHIVRFFPCRVYTDLNCHDTFGYEWPLAHCCHLVVCLMVGLEDYGYTLRMMLSTLLMHLFYCMFIGANQISCLIKMTKILKVRINC